MPSSFWDTEPDAKILAGGRSLIATLNMRLDTPRLLIDINGLDELATVSRTDGELEVGALVRQCTAEHHADIARLAPLMATALPHIAHPAIRNRGTIGGSIAFADPAAELPACVVALNGELEVTGRKGTRRIKADDFFTGLFDTELKPGEILTKIIVPTAGAEHRFGFAELARRHGDYALVGLAASARSNGTVLKISDWFISASAKFRCAPATPRPLSQTGQLRMRLQHSQKTSILKTTYTRRGQQENILRACCCGGSRHNCRNPAMNDRVKISLIVNGETVNETVEARKNLVDFLRDDLALTGSHVGCEHGVCGACTVRVDGIIVRGCLMLAAQCDGSKVETIEGVSDTAEIADLQDAFEKRNALQCGFCTPGMLLTAQELLLHEATPSRDKIREHLSGNYCRCTGYQAIIDAVEAVAQARGAKR